jgi:hypothetical protein
MAYQLAMAKIGTCNSSKYGDLRNKILEAKWQEELVLTSLELDFKLLLLLLLIHDGIVFILEILGCEYCDVE